MSRARRGLTLAGATAVLGGFAIMVMVPDADPFAPVAFVAVGLLFLMVATAPIPAGRDDG